MLGRLAEDLGIQVAPALAVRLHFFHRDAVRLRVGIVPHAGHLPGHLEPGLAAGDLERVAGHLSRHEHLGEAADAGELIAEVWLSASKYLRTGRADQPCGPCGPTGPTGPFAPSEISNACRLTGCDHETSRRNEPTGIVAGSCTTSTPELLAASVDAVRIVAGTPASHTRGVPSLLKSRFDTLMASVLPT